MISKTIQHKLAYHTLFNKAKMVNEKLRLQKRSWSFCKK